MLHFLINPKNYFSSLNGIEKKIPLHFVLYINKKYITY